MKKYKIIGGVLVGYVALNAAVGLYFNIPRHIKEIVAEEKPNQPRLTAFEILAEAFERAFDEKYGPV